MEIMAASARTAGRTGDLREQRAGGEGLGGQPVDLRAAGGGAIFISHLPPNLCIAVFSS